MAQKEGRFRKAWPRRKSICGTAGLPMRERGRKSRGYGHEGVSHARSISPRPRAKNKPSTSQHDKKDAIELAYELEPCQGYLRGEGGKRALEGCGN